MRKDKDKCKNKHETTIGKIIYGFLLFLPLFAIGVTCLVNVFGDNKTAEVKPKNEYATNIVESNDDIKINHIYHVNFIFNDNTSSTIFSYAIYNYDKDNSDIEINYIVQDYKSLDTDNYIFRIQKSTNYIAIKIYDLDTLTDVATIVQLSTGYYSFEFDVPIRSISELGDTAYESFSICDLSKIPNDGIEYTEINTSDIFYYAVEKVEQSPLFNWAQNSVIYTGMNSFTTGLSITTPFIPLLMTYWLIISIVYFLYDIVLVILVVLHKKIHALEESI